MGKATLPSLHIVIPSLFEPLSLWRKDFGFKPESMLVSAIFNHTEEQPYLAKSLEETLFQLIAYPYAELPIAHYRYQLDFGKEPEDKLICADPVHMQTGIDQLIAQPIAWDVICPKDTREILDTLNQHFAEDGLRFEAAPQGRWYMHFKHDDAVTTTPLSAALGQNVRPNLPKSDDLNWLSLLNEIQMLLHRDDLIDARSIAGDLPINSVWFWGAGKELLGLEHDIKTVFGNTKLAEVTALAGKCDHAILPETIEPLLESNSILLLDQLFAPALNDQAIFWQEALDEIAEQYLRPLYAQWQKGKLDIHFYPNDGRKLTLRKRKIMDLFKQPSTDLMDFVAKHK
jgi:hypothetical protein